MEICTLASGSRGNAMLVSCGDTYILVDAGISARRIKQSLEKLDITPDQIAGILITHEHTDHIAGLATLTKQYSIAVYGTCGTERPLRERVPNLGTCFHPILAGERFTLGKLQIYPFATPHDTTGSVGFRIEGDGSSVALVTDLGHVTSTVLEGILGVDVLVAEANHDIDWVKSSPYPYGIIERILGNYGHLSNETGAELICRAVESGTQAVILAHLSPENNTPARALEVVRNRLEQAGTLAKTHVSVAPAAEMGIRISLIDGKVCVGNREEFAVC